VSEACEPARHRAVAIAILVLLGVTGAELVHATHELESTRADLRRCQAAAPQVLDSRAVLVGTGSSGDPLRLAVPHLPGLWGEQP
jgi:hypothetical protein